MHSVVWDSGGPGAGAGAERVYRWKGGYLAVTDDGERDAVYPIQKEQRCECLVLGGGGAYLRLPRSPSRRRSRSMNSWRITTRSAATTAPCLWHRARR